MHVFPRNYRKKLSIKGFAPEKIDIVTPFKSTCYSSFDEKIITKTTYSLLNNVRDDKLKKKYFTNQNL